MSRLRRLVVLSALWRPWRTTRVSHSCRRIAVGSCTTWLAKMQVHAWPLGAGDGGAIKDAGCYGRCLTVLNKWCAHRAESSVATAMAGSVKHVLAAMKAHGGVLALQFAACHALQALALANTGVSGAFRGRERRVYLACVRCGDVGACVVTLDTDHVATIVAGGGIELTVAAMMATARDDALGVFAFGQGLLCTLADGNDGARCRTRSFGVRAVACLHLARGVDLTLP